MSFYKYFSISYLLSSIGCFFVDILYPESRVKIKSKELILKDYKKMFPICLFNLLFSSIPIYLGEIYLSNKKRNNNYFMLNFLIWLFYSDLLFYFIHKSFHSKFLYKYHKLHHEFEYTYGMGSFYSSLPDFVFANLFPIIIPLLILKPNDIFIKFISFFATSYTVIISHGGYKILYQSHLKHHIYKKINYGLAVSDRFFGT